jgi:glyoxylase-like metal-dependent hydrolase (beta-lactamase superfamily II)
MLKYEYKWIITIRLIQKPGSWTKRPNPKIGETEVTIMEMEFYPFQLGNFECVSLCDGVVEYKLESMVTNAPRTDVEAALLAHNLPIQAIYTPYAYLFVDTGQHRVLVDMGAGDLLPTAGKLLHSMRSAGITPESIDSIFITHAHGDHVGGALNDKGEPVFSRATYYICKKELDFWFSEQAAKQAGDWMTEVAREKLAPLKDKTVLIEQEGEILPEVGVLFAPGHTPGHMVVSFASKGKRLLYTGDTVLHPLHLEHPDWLPVFDILPEQAAASKRRIFNLAASTGSWVLGQHFPPFPNLGHVVKNGGEWEWQPVEAKIESNSFS